MIQSSICLSFNFLPVLVYLDVTPRKRHNSALSILMHKVTLRNYGGSIIMGRILQYKSDFTNFL